MELNGVGIGEGIVVCSGVLDMPGDDAIHDVNHWLTVLFNDRHVQMTTGIESPELTERFLNVLNHACAASPPSLTLRQADVLRLTYTRFVDDAGNEVRLTQSDIAQLLGISERTVRNERREALKKVAEAVNS